MKKLLITLGAAALVVSACSDSGAKPSAGWPKDTATEAAGPSASQPPTKAPGSSAQPAQPSPSPAEAPPSQAPEQAKPSESKPQAPEEIKKQYHMNKNFDIVPSDPNGNKKVVLLTFDDGPKEQAMIESLLDTLDKHKAKAIFFVNGYRINAHPELLKLIDQRGGILGNHAWDHINLKNETNAKIDQQIDDVNKLIKELTGKTTQFFRPPFGSSNDYVKEKAKKEGMLFMNWSNGSLDWEMTTKRNDPDKVVENVMSQLHNGSNILLHELSWTAEALDKLLTQIEEKGYSFVDPRAIEPIMR